MIDCKLWIYQKTLLLCLLEKAGLDPPPSPPRRGALQAGLEINGLDSACPLHLEILLPDPLFAMKAGVLYQIFPTFGK